MTRDQPRVVTDVVDGVAEVRLDRPEKLNALDEAMYEELVEAGTDLRDRNDIGAVVLYGAGRAFCAGLDFARFSALRDRRDPRSTAQRPQVGAARALGQQAAHVWSLIDVPVIAAVHGVAFGGGLQITLGADIRIVAPDARLSVMEIHWGLIPDMTGTQLLPELVGRDVAKDLTFTGRIVSGADAVGLRLATRAAEDPLSAARALAGEIADHSRSAVRHAKRLLDMAGHVSLERGLQAEQDAVNQLIGSPEQAAAVERRLAATRPTGRLP